MSEHDHDWADRLADWVDRERKREREQELLRDEPPAVPVEEPEGLDSREWEGWYDELR